MLINLINFFIFAFSLFVPLLLSIAFLTLFERKVLSIAQRRRGPNVVGGFGLLQPFADGIKLVLKETIIPYRSNKFLFIISPMIVFILSILSWFCIPFDFGTALLNFDNSLLYLLALSSLSVYGIIISGWSSNSNYALLGALRSAAQMISYEICLSIIIMPVVLFSNSLNLSDIVLSQSDIYFVIILFPSFIMFLIAGLAETSRVPFDLPEAEAELVSGYNVEYSAFTFALFFLAEYSHLILLSALAAICFLGGWLPVFGSTTFGFLFFIVKIMLFLFFFVWVRATLPRYRFDQLMFLCWKNLFPLSLGFLMFCCSIKFLLL